MSEEITEAELMAEIALLEPKASPPPFTNLQMIAIEAARERGILWDDIANWFNGKFGTNYTSPQMRCKYNHQLKMRR
ncbi:MAG: hypothetical protein PHS93_07785 [Candidatus Omnitrophica bacterium]|nr:hypothetical protein [Candidatus Omnitrophota bacterium]